MDFFKETILDQEAVESAFKQIHYYINMPRHIKGAVSAVQKLENNIEVTTPAHVVEGATTITKGKLNIPLLTYPNQFLNHTTVF